MAIESLGEAMVDLDQIQVGARLRPVSQAGVAQLIASIEALGGHMTDPIQVRVIAGQRGAETRTVLMAGAHRLAAARELGWDTIRARKWRCNDDEAQIFEIDDNLASADLIALDRAVFMAARQEAYLRLHPETAQGGDRRRQKVQNEMISFCSATAETFGKSTRWAEMYVRIGRNLTPEEVARLRGMPAAKQMTDLLRLAKMAPEHRAPVIDKMEIEGVAVATALAKLRNAPTPDPIDKLALDLVDRFERAPKAAKMRMLSMLLARSASRNVIREALALADGGATDA